MKYWIVRIYETVRFEKGDQEIESLILIEAESEEDLAVLAAQCVMQMREDNVYSADVGAVDVGAKEMSYDEWVMMSKFISKFATDEVGEAKSMPGLPVPDTLQ